jgi:hypothetical protein
MIAPDGSYPNIQMILMDPFLMRMILMDPFIIVLTPFFHGSIYHQCLANLEAKEQLHF